MRFKKYIKEATYERVAREDPSRLTVSNGEAGRGVYGYLAPNKKMREYYSGKRGELSKDLKLVKFTVSGKIVDLTKEVDKLIEVAKSEIEKTAQSMKYYVKPKINKSNIQRFPHIIYQYMTTNHPNASGYIVIHKGIGIPTSKQVIVTKPEKIKILSIENI